MKSLVLHPKLRKNVKAKFTRTQCKLSACERKELTGTATLWKSPKYKVQFAAPFQTLPLGLPLPLPSQLPTQTLDLIITFAYPKIA